MIQFDLFGDPIPDATEIELAPKPADDATVMGPPSYGRRLTEKLHAIAAAGFNPLIGTRGPEGQTCGECVHRQMYNGGARGYPKCSLGPQTSGPKTDVRKYWPACHRFEAKP